jgi:hypothetical protein
VSSKLTCVVLPRRIRINHISSENPENEIDEFAKNSRHWDRKSPYVSFETRVRTKMVKIKRYKHQVALFSTTLDSLHWQLKVDAFLAWCQTNCMSINASKSKWMIMGLTGGLAGGLSVGGRGDRAGLLELGADGKWAPIARKLRHYLALPVIPAHRHAFISIMFSSHGLAVERLKWQERYRAPVPRDWRLCRFCRRRVEDEASMRPR